MISWCGAIATLAGRKAGRPSTTAYTNITRGSESDEWRATDTCFLLSNLKFSIWLFLINFSTKKFKISYFRTTVNILKLIVPFYFNLPKVPNFALFFYLLF